MISGLELTPLKIISNANGDIYHGLKSSEYSFKSFGEAYFSQVFFDSIKGWKKHTKMVLNLLVPVGAIKFIIYDDRKNSETYGHFFDVTLSKENYQRLTVPEDVWMAFQGVGKEQNLLLNFASIEHDPMESIACDIDDIPYSWS